MKGYEALRESSAWVDVSGRGRIKVTGEDRARLLHAMTTNRVEGLEPGEGRYAFFLNAQGKILADAVVICREDHFILDTEPETRGKVFDHLDGYIIADDVTLEDITDSTVCLAVEGPQAEGLLRSLGVQPPEQDFSSVGWMARLLYRTSPEQFRIITSPGDRADLTARLGEEADAEATNLVRLEHGVPRYGDEITERFLLQETGQMHSVDFAKGCYLGQEIVERVRSRAQIHRGLAPIAIEGQNPAPARTAILDEAGAKCGEVLSSAYSPALGSVVGLAMMRIDQLGPQAKPMNIDGALVTVRQS